ADRLLGRAAEEVEFEGHRVLVPGPAGLLIASAIHGSIPNREPPVRWLVDAAMILDRAGDDLAWDDVVEFADRFRMARRLERALTLFAEATGRELPAATLGALRRMHTPLIERIERGI